MFLGLRDFSRYILLGQEDPLEEKMAVQSSILAWKIPWTEDQDALPLATRMET